MTAAQLTSSAVLDPAPATPADTVDDLLPILDVVPQAGPPAYLALLAGGAVTCLACAPLVILATIVALSLAVTAAVAALGATILVGPMLSLSRLHRHLARSGRAPAGANASRAATTVVEPWLTPTHQGLRR